MARKKVMTTVYLNVEQDEALKKLHDRTKVPVAEYIREGIDLVLQKHIIGISAQVPLPLVFKQVPTTVPVKTPTSKPMKKKPR